MFRQICKKVIGTQRVNADIQRCLQANFCSRLGEDEGVVSEPIVEEKTGKKEFSFCRTLVMGRVGTKPKLIEAGNKPFAVFTVGVSPGLSGVKWFDVHVNKEQAINSVMKNFHIGDRVYIEGNLSYIADGIQRKHRIYSDHLRIISHSKKYWEDKNKAEIETTEDFNDFEDIEEQNR